MESSGEERRVIYKSRPCIKATLLQKLSGKPSWKQDGSPDLPTHRPRPPSWSKHPTGCNRGIFPPSYGRVKERLLDLEYYFLAYYNGNAHSNSRYGCPRQPYLFGSDKMGQTGRVSSAPERKTERFSCSVIRGPLFPPKLPCKWRLQLGRPSTSRIFLKFFY